MKKYFPKEIEPYWPHSAKASRGKQKIGRYFPKDIEAKWQKIWQEQGINKFKPSKSSKGKYYNLVELPYPSGDLHLGHWFAFVPADAHARYMKMAGANVFFPNGFDAFGLPAENAAIKKGIHPKDWTLKNIETMRSQFETMGTMIDWNYTATTCMPDYYRWNQWIFLKMFEKGIAYRGKALSNWCPVDQTVLANEHIENGCCWRCGTEVIQKEVEQWFLKITDYANELIWPASPDASQGGPETDSNSRQPHLSDDARQTFPKSSKAPRSLSESRLSNSKDNQNEQEPSFSSSESGLPPVKDNALENQNWPARLARQASSEVVAGWPKDVREGQNNWIGKSEGVEFDLQIKGSKEKISVYTTRIDTVFGMTYVVLAPEHRFVAELLNLKSQISNLKYKEIQKYVEDAKRKTEMERKEDRIKSGIFTGEYAINPFNGEEVPVWIADYVLAGYGTGAIMAVPGHDDRDFEFAKKFGLPIKEVVIPVVIDKHDPPKEGFKTVFRKAVQVILINPKNKKVLALRWKKFPWTTFITGGVEEGEDIIESAKREIKEEVGYSDIEYIKTLGGPVESHFYANHKQENRKALFTGLVFYLKSEKQDSISKEELSIHEPTWMTWEELDKDKNIKCSEYEIWLDRLSDDPPLFTDYGALINSGKYDGLSSKEAQNKLADWVEKEKNGRRKINYHLRDWSISRQRYWGTPIPIIYCSNCAKDSKTGGQPHAALDTRSGSVLRSSSRLDEFSDASTPASATGELGARSPVATLMKTSSHGKTPRAFDTGDTFETKLPPSVTPFKISIIDGEEYAMVPVPYKDLPVELPYNVDYTPKGKPPLATDEKWLNVKCPNCGGEAKRDAETLDTFFDSAWYYYRYVSPDYKDGPFDKLRVKELMPVDIYFGGSEHTLGHTLYARFFTKFFKDLGLVDFDEFAKKRVQHGIVLGSDGNKMSKSRGNVVSPDDVVKEFGADTVRLYLCFMMPYEATAPWSAGAIYGVFRFLKRVWELQDRVKGEGARARTFPLTLSASDLFMMHKTIKKVGSDLEMIQFNTAVSSLMSWINYLSSKSLVSKEEYQTFLKLLAPFAPHITEELWAQLDDRKSKIESRASKIGSGRSVNPQSSNLKNPSSTIHSLSSNHRSIHLEQWPQYEDKFLTEENIQVVVQVNGKMRDVVSIPYTVYSIQKEVEKKALESEKVQRYMKGSVKKTIYVKGKIINFVMD